jgi:hypothetical protein
MVAMVLLRLDTAIVIDPMDDSKVTATKVLEGVTYKVDTDGQLFRVNKNGRWAYVEAMLQPHKMRAAFEEDNGVVYRVDRDDGRRFRTRNRLSDGFEKLPIGISGLRELISPKRGWGSISLQSPKAPKPEDSRALSTQILAEGGAFRDASVAPDDTRAQAGIRALRCATPPPYRGMLTCQSSLTSPLLYFKKGDDFWFRAYYFVEDALPAAIMSLECPWLTNKGELRLVLDKEGHLTVELTCWNKPKYRQSNETAIAFPTGRWVKVNAHFHFSDTEQGIIQIWQDDQLIIDTTGSTLALPDIFYSSLEIGITAHSNAEHACTVWVDQVLVADQRIH